MKVVGAGAGEVLKVGPSEIHVLLAGAESDGRATVVEERLPPSSGAVPPHVHRSMDHLFFVIEGSVRFTADGAAHDVDAGGFVFVPRGVAHAFENVAHDAPARFLEVDTPGGFDEYFRKLSAVLAEHGFDVPKIRELQADYDTHPPA